MIIEIKSEEDRLKVAAILVRNGYKVWQSKKRNTPTGKSYTYYVEAEKLPDPAAKSNE